MNTEELVELGSSAVDVLNDLSKAAGHVERIINTIKKDPAAWEEVRKHFKNSSDKLDAILKLRGIIDA